MECRIDNLLELRRKIMNGMQLLLVSNHFLSLSLSLSPRERNKDNTERSLSEGCGINFRGKRFVSFSLSLFLSLKHLPESNATWSNDTVQLLPNIDVGVAVAVEGGLITPIINNANRLSVYDISIKIKVVDPIW